MPESRVNRKERDALRQAVEAGAQLQYIARDIQALELGAERVRVDVGEAERLLEDHRATVVGAATGGRVEVERPLDKSRVAALSAALNGRFRLLAKVMPDLKAVELDLGEDTMGALRGFNSIERAARVAFLLERLREGRARPDIVGGDSDLDSVAGSTERRPSFLS